MWPLVVLGVAAIVAEIERAASEREREARERYIATYNAVEARVGHHQRTMAQLVDQFGRSIDHRRARYQWIEAIAAADAAYACLKDTRAGLKGIGRCRRRARRVLDQLHRQLDNARKLRRWHVVRNLTEKIREVRALKMRLDRDWKRMCREADELAERVGGLNRNTAAIRDYYGFQPKIARG